MKHLYLSALFMLSVFVSFAQTNINGMLEDRESRKPMEAAQLINVNSGETGKTDRKGMFKMTVRPDDLIEIHVPGYNTAKLRIKKGAQPSFYKIYLDKINLINPDQYASSDLTDYQKDSIKRRDLYANTLNVPQMTGFEQIEGPFTAISRAKAWRFQKDFSIAEQERYIDFMFNEKLVAQITGLQGDDLQRFMRVYRPRYENLRAMGDYDFYMYVRRAAEIWRRDRPGTPRNSG